MLGIVADRRMGRTRRPSLPAWGSSKLRGGGRDPGSLDNHVRPATQRGVDRAGGRGGRTGRTDSWTVRV